MSSVIDIPLRFDREWSEDDADLIKSKCALVHMCL